MSNLPRSRKWFWPLVLLTTVFAFSLYFFHWRLEPAPRFILGTEAKVRVLDVTSDSGLLAVAADEQIQLWRIETGEQYACIPLPGQRIEHAIFTPDGKRLITNSFLKTGKGREQSAHIIIVASKQIEAVLPLSNWMDQAIHYSMPRSIVASPDGNYLAYLAPHRQRSDLNSWCEIKLWDLTNGKEKGVLEEKSYDYLSPLAFSPDSRYLAAGISRAGEKVIEVKFWDVASAKLTHTFSVPPTTGKFKFQTENPIYEGVHSLVFSPNGQTLIGMVSHNTSGYDQQLLVWNLKKAQLEQLLASEELRTGGNAPVLRVTNSGQKVLITAAHPLLSYCYLCNISGPEPHKELSYASVPILSHDGNHLAVGNQFFDLLEKPAIQLIGVANRESSTVCKLFFGFQGMLTPLAFSPTDQQLAVQTLYFFSNSWYKPVLDFILEPERMLHVHEVSSGNLQGRLTGTEARFTPDGKALMAYEEKTPMIEQQKGGVIRVYSFPLSHPWLSILGWAILMSMPFALLIAWRYRRHSPRGSTQLLPVKGR